MFKIADFPGYLSLRSIEVSFCILSCFFFVALVLYIILRKRKPIKIKVKPDMQSCFRLSSFCCSLHSCRPPPLHHCSFTETKRKRKNETITISIKRTIYDNKAKSMETLSALLRPLLQRSLPLHFRVRASWMDGGGGGVGGEQERE